MRDFILLFIGLRSAALKSEIADGTAAGTESGNFDRAARLTKPDDKKLSDAAYAFRRGLCQRRGSTGTEGLGFMTGTYETPGTVEA